MKTEDRRFRAIPWTNQMTPAIGAGSPVLGIRKPGETEFKPPVEACRVLSEDSFQMAKAVVNAVVCQNLIHVDVIRRVLQENSVHNWEDVMRDLTI